MTDDELALILLGAKASSYREFSAARAELDTASRRLIGKLGPDRCERLATMLDRVFVEPIANSGVSSPAPGIVIAFATGLSVERRIRLVVDDSIRNVELRFPFSTYQLRVDVGGWKAIGLSSIHERTCAIDLSHVRKAELTNEPYVIPAGSLDYEDADLELL